MPGVTLLLIACGISAGLAVWGWFVSARNYNLTGSIAVCVAITCTILAPLLLLLAGMLVAINEDEAKVDRLESREDIDAIQMNGRSSTIIFQKDGHLCNGFYIEENNEFVLLDTYVCED